MKTFNIHDINIHVKKLETYTHDIEGAYQLATDLLTGYYSYKAYPLIYKEGDYTYVQVRSNDQGRDVAAYWDPRNDKWCISNCFALANDCRCEPTIHLFLQHKDYEWNELPELLYKLLDSDPVSVPH